MSCNLPTLGHNDKMKKILKKISAKLPLALSLSLSLSLSFFSFYLVRSLSPFISAVSLSFSLSISILSLFYLFQPSVSLFSLISHSVPLSVSLSLFNLSLFLCRLSHSHSLSYSLTVSPLCTLQKYERDVYQNISLIKLKMQHHREVQVQHNNKIG